MKASPSRRCSTCPSPGPLAPSPNVPAIGSKDITGLCCANLSCHHPGSCCREEEGLWLLMEWRTSPHLLPFLPRGPEEAVPQRCSFLMWSCTRARLSSPGTGGKGSAQLKGATCRIKPPCHGLRAGSQNPVWASSELRAGHRWGAGQRLPSPGPRLGLTAELQGTRLLHQ